MPVARPLPLVAAVMLLVGAGALGALALAPTPAEAASPSGGTITVSGTGSASAVPDVVRTTLGAQASAPTVDAALSVASEATATMLDALSERGVARRDVRTAGVAGYPQLDGDGRGVSGHTASQDLDVTLRDLGAAGATISAVVTAGDDAARLSGVSFTLADEGALRSDARKAASADARAVAIEQARLAGGTLGAVVSVREDSGGPSFASGGGASAVSAESAVPLEPGTTDVSVTALVRWELER